MATSSQPAVTMTDAINAEKEREFRARIDARLTEVLGAIASLTREVQELKGRSLTAPVYSEPVSGRAPNKKETK